MPRSPRLLAPLLVAFAFGACGRDESPPPTMVDAPESPADDGSRPQPRTEASEAPGVVAPSSEAPSPEAPTTSSPEPEPPREGTRTGIVAEGESLSRILARHGLDAATIHRITAALGEHMDVAKIAVGQSWAIEYDDRENVSAFEYAVSPVLRIRAEIGEDDEVTARAIETETTLHLQAVSGEIETSLWEAVTDAGEQGALVMMIADVFASGIDFYTETRKGDRFTALVEKRLLPDGTLSSYGRVLAATYEGAAGSFEGAYWEAPDGSTRGWFDRDGKSLDRTLLKSPLKFTRISSGFNPRRMHPVLHRVKGHNGTDYAAPEGTPVWAAADGVIAFRGKKGGAGNMVILSHAGGMKTLYMHLSRFEDGQRVGQKVAQRTVIGYVGQTGLATGPHLHFAVRLGGRYVDPQEVKSVPKPGVPRNHLSRFRKDTADAFERLAALASATRSPDDGRQDVGTAQPHARRDDGGDDAHDAVIRNP